MEHHSFQRKIRITENLSYCIVGEVVKELKIIISQFDDLEFNRSIKRSPLSAPHMATSQVSVTAPPTKASVNNFKNHLPTEFSHYNISIAYRNISWGGGKLSASKM